MKKKMARRGGGEGKEVVGERGGQASSPCEMQPLRATDAAFSNICMYVPCMSQRSGLIMGSEVLCNHKLHEPCASFNVLSGTK